MYIYVSKIIRITSQKDVAIVIYRRHIYMSSSMCVHRLITHQYTHQTKQPKNVEMIAANVPKRNEWNGSLLKNMGAREGRSQGSKGNERNAGVSRHGSV